MNNKKLIASLLLGCTLTVGCVSTESWPPEQRPNTWGQALQLSDNFYQISPTVFRSEQPDANLVTTLKKHGIQRVINLRRSNLDAKVFAEQPFELVHIPINTWAINREDLLQVMRNIQQAELKQEKVLVHCYHGSDRTGASIAMYRIIFQNWSTQDALNEMKHGGYGFHPIWSNIEPLFSDENIAWMREQLKQPVTMSPNH